MVFHLKRFVFFAIVMFSVSACEDDKELPEGFEHISNSGNHHFVYMDKKHLKDRHIQRKTCKKICTKIYNHNDYCEVYIWTKKSDVPLDFPIINTKTIIGKFEMKDDKIKFKPPRT